MKYGLLFGGWLLTTAAFGQNTPTKAVNDRAALAPLAWLLGDWHGTGWQYTRSGQRESFTQHEHVEAKLGGTLLQFDGLGMQHRDTVHQAMAILYREPDQDAFRFRPFTTEYKDKPAKASVNGQQLIWQIQVDSGRLVRYTIRQGSAGEWIELGEMSQNAGQSWSPFFTMTLTKQPASLTR